MYQKRRLSAFNKSGNDDTVSVPVGWNLGKVSRSVFIADMLKTILLMSASQDPTRISRLTSSVVVRDLKDG